MAGHKRKYILTYAGVTLFLLLMIYPYLYMMLNSVASWDQIDKKVFPTSFTLRSWDWIFGDPGAVAFTTPWLLGFANSILVAAASTILMMLSAVFAAYALAKIPFKGKAFVNNFILFQMFFPSIILLVPQFLLIIKMGIYDTYFGMIMPTSVSVWAIFMYYNFFKAIPDTLIEAAKLDGAGNIKMLFKIVLPMSTSISTVILLFLFTERWTNLLWDMISTKNENISTLNVMISQMFGPYRSYPGPMYAASTLLTLPLILIFLLCSKKFKEGMQFSLK